MSEIASREKVFARARAIIMLVTPCPRRTDDYARILCERLFWREARSVTSAELGSRSPIDLFARKHSDLLCDTWALVVLYHSRYP